MLLLVCDTHLINMIYIIIQISSKLQYKTCQSWCNLNMIQTCLFWLVEMSYRNLNLFSKMVIYDLESSQDHSWSVNLWKSYLDRLRNCHMEIEIHYIKWLSLAIEIGQGHWQAILSITVSYFSMFVLKKTI